MFANLTEPITKMASLGWLKQLGYTGLPVTQLSFGGSVPEREFFSDVVLVGRLREAIRQINPVSSKAPQATVAQPATVQSSSWLNP